jgi:hypothetical protein
MPRDTMASAMDLISTSLTLHPNVFHEFQPMGGVAAKIAGTGPATLPASRFAPASGTALGVAAAPPRPALSPLRAGTAKPPGSASPPAVPTADELLPASPLGAPGAPARLAPCGGFAVTESWAPEVLPLEPQPTNSPESAAATASRVLFLFEFIPPAHASLFEGRSHARRAQYRSAQSFPGIEPEVHACTDCAGEK